MRAEKHSIVLNRRMHLFDPQVELTGESTAKQAKIKRFFEESVYNRLPFEFTRHRVFEVAQTFDKSLPTGESEEHEGTDRAKVQEEQLNQRFQLKILAHRVRDGNPPT
jgi:hypothetical protein